jgi:hypothetical protein
MAAVNMKAAEPALPDRTAALTAAVPEAGSSSHQVVEMPEGFWYPVKRRVLGPPLVTEQLKNERLSKPLALGVLSRTVTATATAEAAALRDYEWPVPPSGTDPIGSLHEPGRAVV